MEEIQQVLYCLLEKHLSQTSVIKHGHHLLEDQTEMFPLGNKENEATFCSHLRIINGHNRKRFFKYQQLKQEDRLSFGSEEGMSIYINPRSDYDNVYNPKNGM